MHRLPRHIAIIMDGNGRWAQQHGNDRLYGHTKGVSMVRRIVEACGHLGIEYLTLYVFSMENWSRPKQEVAALMGLLSETIAHELDMLMQNNVRLHLIGALEQLPETVRNEMQAAICKTQNNTGLNLVLALCYSAREEIVLATKRLAKQVLEGKEIESITQQDVAAALYTKDFPDPDLLIRTSGEVRISNFLLWQIAYSELYFTQCLWPDFTEEELYKAIINYQCRERRFGKTSEQL